MRFTGVISALCLLLSATTLAAPIFGGVSDDSTNDYDTSPFFTGVGVSKRDAAPIDHGAIEDRAAPILASIALSLVTEYADDAIKFIADIANMNEKKDKWVKKTMALLSSQYPSLNIVIYSNHKGTYDFGGPSHARRFNYDLPIAAFGVKETYHILFSDNVGWFLRAGDGGYINWILSAGDGFDMVLPQDKLAKFVRK